MPAPLQNIDFIDLKKQYLRLKPEIDARMQAVLDHGQYIMGPEVKELEQQLAEKKVEVTFTDHLRQTLAKKGFDPLMGARPMQRLIQDTIRKALADELLFGRLVNGGRLTVDLDAEGKAVLDITPASSGGAPAALPEAVGS